MVYFVASYSSYRVARDAVVSQRNMASILKDVYGDQC